MCPLLVRRRNDGGGLLLLNILWSRSRLLLGDILGNWSRLRWSVLRDQSRLNLLHWLRLGSGLLRLNLLKSRGGLLWWLRRTLRGRLWSSLWLGNWRLCLLWLQFRSRLRRCKRRLR